jgi:gliding motility-associated-like protein
VTGYPVGLPGCSSSDQVIVTPDPNSSAGEDTELEICPNEPIFDMTAALDGNPAPGGTWTYIGAADDGSFDATVDLEGPYQYEIPAGCTAFLTISFSDALNFVIPNDTSLCDAGTVSMDLYQLTGTPGYAYNWTYDGSVVSNEASTVLSPIQSGQACLNITDGCNVSIEQCFDVEVLPFVDVQYSVDTTATCWPDGFTLVNGTDPSTFNSAEWVLSDGTSIYNVDSTLVTFDTPGNYTVNLILTNSAGCSYNSSQTFSLQNFAPPVAGYVASPQPTNIMNPEVQFTDMTQGYPIAEYLWTFSTPAGELLGGSAAANPFFEFPNDYGGDYIVNLQVTDIHNCTDVISPSVITVDDLTQFYIPTGFTPNNDGLNDVLKFEGADIDPERFNFEIFNRNGELVFESKDPTSGWAGNIRGGEHFAPNGVYSWRAIVVSKSTGVKKDISGDVIIMR